MTTSPHLISSGWCRTGRWPPWRTQRTALSRSPPPQPRRDSTTSSVSSASNTCSWIVECRKKKFPWNFMQGNFMSSAYDFLWNLHLHVPQKNLNTNLKWNSCWKFILNENFTFIMTFLIENLWESGLVVYPCIQFFLKKQLENLHKIKNIIENLNFLSFFRLQSLATPRSAWCCNSHSIYQLLYRETPQDGRIPYISENNEQNWIFIFSMYILYTMHCVIIFLMQCFLNSDNLQL